MSAVVNHHKRREYYVTFDDDKRGRKVQASSAESAARLFLGVIEREDNTRCVLVGTQEMWSRNEHYIYYLQGVPSPTRRFFECYVTEIIDGEVFYIFQCSKCEFERVYGSAKFCARPETTIAHLVCNRCSRAGMSLNLLKRPKHTLHRFVEIASPAMAKRIQSASISTSFTKSLESGRMLEAVEKVKIKRIPKGEGGCIDCGKLRGEDGTTVRCRPCADAVNRKNRRAS